MSSINSVNTSVWNSPSRISFKLLYTDVFFELHAAKMALLLATNNDGSGANFLRMDDGGLGKNYLQSYAARTAAQMPGPATGLPGKVPQAC